MALYHYERCDRTASEGHEERVGVCRDFAHLAVRLCRCMNIPARYCTGYLGDIGVPQDPAPMDFSAWFEPFSVEKSLLPCRGRDAALICCYADLGPSRTLIGNTHDRDAGGLPFELV